MSDNILKGVCLFIAGVGVGSACTYFYLKKNNKIEYEYVKPAGPAPEPVEDENSQNESVEEVKETTSYEEMVDGDIMAYYNEAVNNVDSHYIDYSSVNRPKVEDIPEDKPNIYEITADEFLQEGSEFDKRTLALYEGDSVLVDETVGIDEPVDDIPNTITEELFSKFQNDENSDEVYIRNLMYGTDYEIYKRMEKYSELVGMDEIEE